MGVYKLHHFNTGLSNTFQAPVPLTIFRSNSKFNKKFVVLLFITNSADHSDIMHTSRPLHCLEHVHNKFRCDRLSIFETRALQILVEFRITGRAPGVLYVVSIHMVNLCIKKLGIIFHQIRTLAKCMFIRNSICFDNFRFVFWFVWGLRSLNNWWLVSALVIGHQLKLFIQCIWVNR